MITERAEYLEQAFDAIVEVRYSFVAVNDPNISGLNSGDVREIANHICEALNDHSALQKWLKENKSWCDKYEEITINCSCDPDLEETRWGYSAKTDESGIDEIWFNRDFKKYLDADEIETMMNIIDRLLSKVSCSYSPKNDSFTVQKVKERECVARYNTRHFERVKFC